MGSVPRLQKGLEVARMARRRNGSFRILWRCVRAVDADGILIGYAAFLAVCCGILRVWEPETFPSYGSAVWYVFQTITTIGFGDAVAQTPLCRAITIAIGLSALLIVGLTTGIVVNYFSEIVRARRNESFLAFERNLERLTELSPEELEDMQRHYAAFKKSRGSARKHDAGN